ncbi:AEC family transporter [Pseudovibrio sp. SPO723]|uniref:AEC family transporter n=1 Tax=Nesiotobacter zosterae TaxID=392721 RepID=UPI0029C51301|nr:AEC family transporter [Pseudovibrio sp. SPO723]MDX5594994.1 AEC family transporter [Pseudovibrio sp. SPO723]
MFQQTVQLVLPIFILIGLGYACASLKLLKEGVGQALGSFCVTILVPVLIFRTLTGAELGDVSPFPFWLAYYSALTLVYFVAAAIVRWGFKREARAAVVAGLTAGFSNTGLIGIPLISSLFGPEGLVPLSLIIALHIPFVTILSVSLMSRAVVIDGYEEARPINEVLQSVIKSLISNPIIIGILSGVAVNLVGLPIPSIAETVLTSMATAATPVALFAVGMGLVDYGIRGTLKIATVLSVLKIGLLPLTVFIFMSQFTDLPPLWVAVATMGAACPTGLNAYLLAVQFGTGHAMSSNAITITTFTAIFTVSGWLAFLQAFGY